MYRISVNAIKTCRTLKPFLHLFFTNLRAKNRLQRYGQTSSEFDVVPKARDLFGQRIYHWRLEREK